MFAYILKSSLMYDTSLDSCHFMKKFILIRFATSLLKVLTENSFSTFEQHLPPLPLLNDAFIDSRKLMHFPPSLPPHQRIFEWPLRSSSTGVYAFQ